MDHKTEKVTRQACDFHMSITAESKGTRTIFHVFDVTTPGRDSTVPSLPPGSGTNLSVLLHHLAGCQYGDVGVKSDVGMYGDVGMKGNGIVGLSLLTSRKK